VPGTTSPRELWRDPARMEHVEEALRNAAASAQLAAARVEVSRLEGLFSEVARVVRPGGAIALLDASTPDNALLRVGHGVYFGHVVPLIGGLLSDHDAYAYLPRSMAYLPPPNEILAMLRAAGFPSARRLQLSGGITQLFVGNRA